MRNKVCGDCRLFEVFKEVGVEEQRKTLDGLADIDYGSLNDAEKVAFDNMLYYSLVPQIKLGRRMFECEQERRAVDSTAPCDHPEKYSPLP